MGDPVYDRARKSPYFAQLVSERSKLTWLLSIVVLVLFYGFVLVAAFFPATIGARVSEGSTLTIGVAAGLFIFVFFWLLMAFYVWRANTAYDALNAKIVEDSRFGPRS